jgi:hypothetical protein
VGPARHGFGLDLAGLAQGGLDLGHLNGAGNSSTEQVHLSLWLLGQFVDASLLGEVLHR